MSKLPSVDDAPPRKPQAKPQELKPVKQDSTNPISEGYLPRRVDVKLPMRHRHILRDKLRKLQDAGATLEDGTQVSDKTKAILWILENEVKV